MTETFHLDCTRTSATAFKCIVERSKRSDTRLFALDESSLTGARTDRETHIDPQDNSVTVSYHLTLIQPNGPSPRTAVIAVTLNSASFR